MDEHEKQSRADAAQDADATQFITVDRIPNEDPNPRRSGLTLAIVLGALVGLALLATAAYVYHKHSVALLSPHGGG